MIALYVIIPVTVLAVVIAVVPVLLGSIRHNRAMRAGDIETTDSAGEEAALWHRMLGHRSGPRLLRTPDLLNDDEVARVVGEPEEKIEVVDGESAWKPRRQPS